MATGDTERSNLESGPGKEAEGLLGDLEGLIFFSTHTGVDFFFFGGDSERLRLLFFFGRGDSLLCLRLLLGEGERRDFLGGL